MTKIVFAALVLVATSQVSFAQSDMPGIPMTAGGGSGGPSILTAGCVFTSSGIDCVDPLAHVFNIQNSGAGALILQVDGGLVWNINNDGPGSLLDADTLDGLSSDAFLKVDASNDPLTGQLALQDMTDCSSPKLASASRLTTGLGTVESTNALTFCRAGSSVGNVTGTWNFAQDVLADVDDARNLGADATRWRRAYLREGTEALPSLTLRTSDTDTGIWSPAAGQLAVSIDGAREVLVTSSGVRANRFFADDASATVPEYTWDGDDDTGLDHPGAGVVVGYSDGNDIWKWNSVGLSVIESGTANDPALVVGNSNGFWTDGSTHLGAVTSSGTVLWESDSVTGLTVGDGTVVTTGTMNLQMQRIIGTAPVKPACTDATTGGNEGSWIYVDDTDDLFNGQPCVCMPTAANRSAFGWINLGGAACAGT